MTYIHSKAMRALLDTCLYADHLFQKSEKKTLRYTRRGNTCKGNSTPTTNQHECHLLLAKNFSKPTSSTFSFQQIAFFKLGNCTHLKAFFLAEFTDFPYLVHFKSWK